MSSEKLGAVIEGLIIFGGPTIWIVALLIVAIIALILGKIWVFLWKLG